MKRRMAILRTITVGTLAIALAGTALGSDIRVTVAGANAAQDSGASAAQHATLNVDLPAVAASVVSALVGGENPSTLAARESVTTQVNAKRHGGDKADKANEEAKDADEDTDNDEATETEVETNQVSTGQQVVLTGTAGSRPGFGCGDKNHDHSEGPPGRPNASLPPGCTKH